MSTIILHGSRVSNKKIKSAGFDFEFSKLQKAFKSLIWTELIFNKKIHIFNWSGNHCDISFD